MMTKRIKRKIKISKVIFYLRDEQYALFVKMH